MSKEEFEKRYMEIMSIDFFWRLVGVLPINKDTISKKYELEKLYQEVKRNGLE